MTMENDFKIDDKDPKMKFCPECGFPLTDCFKFCPNCGKNLSENSISNLPAAQPQAKSKSREQDFNDSIKKENNEKFVAKSDLPQYIREQLIYGENVVFLCHVHWKIWIPACFWFAVIAGIFFPASREPDYFLWIILVPLVPFIYYFIKAYIEQSSTCLAVTNKRVICKFGFIRRSSFEINLDKVEGVNLEQSFLGRIFDCSTVIVSGTGSSHAPVPNIIDARDFKQILLSESEKYKNKNRN